jgi:hypothetical protein
VHPGVSASEPSLHAMENPTSAEVLAAAQVLRRFNQYLNEQATAQAQSPPATCAEVHPVDVLESRVLAEMQTVDDIIAKLVAWAEQLKQRQTIRRSHVQSV